MSYLHIDLDCRSMSAYLKSKDVELVSPEFIEWSRCRDAETPATLQNVLQRNPDNTKMNIYERPKLKYQFLNG